MESEEKIKQLDNLLAMIGSPKEGDKVIYTLEEYPGLKFEGVIKKKISTYEKAIYTIETCNKKYPPGSVNSIEYKNRIFRTKSNSGWKQI
jgi:hypothetical protein